MAVYNTGAIEIWLDNRGRERKPKGNKITKECLWTGWNHIVLIQSPSFLICLLCVYTREKYWKFMILCCKNPLPIFLLLHLPLILSATSIFSSGRRIKKKVDWLRNWFKRQRNGSNVEVGGRLSVGNSVIGSTGDQWVKLCIASVGVPYTWQIPCPLPRGGSRIAVTQCCTGT